MIMAKIQDIETIVPKNSAGRDRAFLSLQNEEWKYYIEDCYRRYQEGYKLNERAYDKFGLDDVEECVGILEGRLKEISKQLGLDYDEIQGEIPIERLTVRSLVNRVATVKSHEEILDHEHKRIIESWTYAKKNGSEILLISEQRRDFGEYELRLQGKTH